MNDFYRENGLKEIEIKKLSAMCEVLPTVADIAHAQVSIYLNSLLERSLLVLAQTKPHTAFIYYRKSEAGLKMRYADEPLVSHVFETGMSITGKKEWHSTDTTTALALYPLKTQGRVFAVVVFEFLDTKQCFPSRGEFLNVAMDILERAEQISIVLPRFTTMDGLMLADPQGRIVAVNNLMQNVYLTMGVENILGRKITDRQLHLEEILRFYNQHQRGEYELHTEGRVWQQQILPIYAGKILCHTVIAIADVTELKLKDEQLMVKSAVIQEIHHRVKNNLQTVAGLLRIKARHSQSAETQTALKESLNQILSIAVVHEFLSGQQEDLISLHQLLQMVVEMSVKDIPMPRLEIEYDFKGADVNMNSGQANSLAIIMSELLQNTLKHAFVGRENGKIMVGACTYAEGCRLSMKDDGVGLPEDFDLNKSVGTGLKIIKTLVDYDLKGNFTLKNGTQGTLASMEITIL